MNAIETNLRSALADLSDTHKAGNFFAVPTHCLYPSNEAVVVYVSGGRNECRVSDLGEALRTARVHGAKIPSSDRWLRNLCAHSGLESKEGAILSPASDFKALQALIVLVANAAASAARYAMENFERKSELSEEVDKAVYGVFSRESVRKKGVVAGTSGRHYHFDYVVNLGGDAKVLVDAVSPHPASINAKTVAHIDVGRSDESRFQQAVVFDPLDSWRSEDLSLLSSVATTIDVHTATSNLAKLVEQSIRVH